MNIVYVFDENFAVCAAVSMASLLENIKTAELVHFYIFDDGITDDSKKKLILLCKHYRADITFIDAKPVSAYLEELKVHPWRGRYSAYIKLMIASFLPQEIERVIVLDADTVINGNIYELATMDLHGHPCAMALEGIHGDYQEISGLGKSELYNTGVIVYDLPIWRQNRVEARFIYHLTNICAKYMLPEENPISEVLRGDVERLHPKFNFITQFYLYGNERYFRRFHWDKLGDKFYSLDEIKEAKADARILHCIDTFTSRPWYRESIHPYNEYYNYYLAMTPWKDIPKKSDLMSGMTKIEYTLRKYLPTPLSAYMYFVAAKLVYTTRAKRFYSIREE